MEREYKDGLVSVIIPVYNAERFLEEAVNSALSQDYGDIEIILADDRSSDSSAEIIGKMREKHPNIRYHLMEKNMGAGAARNKALELAGGRYAAFLDSDDVWLPDKIRRQLQLMKEKNSPLSYTAIEMIDENGDTVKEKRAVREECDYKFLLRNTMIATSSVVADRAVLGDFRMPLRRGGQDYALWLSLLRDGAKACGINEALVKYRLVSGSLSSNKLKSVRQVWEIQTRDEKIGKVSAFINVGCFCLNAFRKYFL